MAPATILMIDDEAAFAHFVKRNLEAEGPYKVLLAPDGRQGLRAAREHRPDLILLDLMMPEMDGFEVLRHLKADPGTVQIPVLMLTAVHDATAKTQASQLYDEDYLEKPIEVNQLAAQIQRVLTRLHGSPESRQAA